MDTQSRAHSLEPRAPTLVACSLETSGKASLDKVRNVQIGQLVRDVAQCVGGPGVRAEGILANILHVRALEILRLRLVERRHYSHPLSAERMFAYISETPEHPKCLIENSAVSSVYRRATLV
ncbi:hypothetical protein PsYK624_063690 [Phanerochaete sordida]|uniref:Uncharacterized protein n=1 Tax=Phanerochaete sordida TaxID=48140 RepID=A0A9P3GA74_9APHY|nr:hypothetical protein PsYK624_063690 [Phanerochaete sordida]